MTDPQVADEAPAHRAAAVVLAAGSARRFGATKQLAHLRGRPLVAHVIAAAHDAGCGRIIVVVGHDRDAVARAAATAGDVDLAVNPDHRTGQSSSLRAGIEHAAFGGQDIAVILLADQPAVRADAVRAVTAAVAGGAAAARAHYDDGAGHPVAFARRVWPQLSAVTGDRGARDLLASLGTIEVPVRGVGPADVDRPGDLPTGGR